MRNWKELGEVPDSEDESLDSLEPQQDEHADFETEHERLPNELPKAPAIEDVWRIPSSPQRQDHGFLPPDDAGTTSPAPQRSVTPASSPLSSLSPEEEDHQEQSGHRESSLEQGIVDQNPRTPTDDNPRNEPSSLGDDEVSRPYVRITAASSADELAPGQAAALIRSLSPRCSPGEVNRQVSAGDGVVEGVGVSTQGAVQRERSLRPRKPIQQFPYLLENAQYANFMKSHGVRPLRVSIERAIPRTRTEEDSQEQEFEASASQELAADGTSGGIDESQPLLFDDATDDRDILALSSSPPSSSSPRTHLHTSSQQANGDQTDNSSIVEEDFPSLDDLARKPAKTPARNSKRYHSSNLLSSRKRFKPQLASSALPSPLSRLSRSDIWDMSSLSPEPRAMPEPSQDLGITPRLPPPRRPERPSDTASDRSRSLERNTPSDIVDLTGKDGSESSSDSETGSSSSDSNIGADLVRRNKRRIRGVLPASWLRLDRQRGRDAARKNRRSRDPSPDPGPRRGVAVPKLSTPKPSTTAPFLFDDSDDDNDDNELVTKPIEEHEVRPPSALDMLFDDAGDDSVVEEDHIDRMLSGAKRSGTSSGLPPFKKRKTTQKSVSTGLQVQKTRQPRITQALSRSHTTTRGTHGTIEPATNPVGRPHQRSHKRRLPKRAPTPPLLSILDVVEPEAPRFIRVAARTARTQRNQGKSSPSRKHIDLGTRRDNVDARSVLHDWRAGKIRPKIPNSVVNADGQARRHVLGDLSVNSATPSSTLRESAHPKPVGLAKHGHILGHVVADGVGIRDKSPRIRRPKPITQPSARPAQLEIDEHERPDTARFVAKKRALDALYRKGRKTRTLSTAASLAQLPDNDSAPGELQSPGDDLGPKASASPRPPQRDNKKSRFRKRFAPRQIDLEAPRFTHANDPLPEDSPIVHEAEEPSSQDKLTGLGPYGTHYTQHFEVFPLDHGVFFHESTIIGRGCINKLMEPAYLDKVRQTRPRASFAMDGQTLRWGSWDDTASSELGILVDWITEQLSHRGTTSEDFTALKRAVGGSEFILLYVLDSLSLSDDEAAKSFIGRTAEVFQGLLARIEESASTVTMPETTSKAYIEVLACSLVTILAVSRLNHGAGSNFSVNLQLEELLTRAARQCIKRLLGVGLEDLRVLYGELQQLSGRECGIRRDHTIANSWVALIRVLESACIPRSSFWDITQAVMMEPKIMLGSEAKEFERLWRDMFTLLPLCEFDNSGVLTVGMRHLSPIEGWSLPQQVLKRVFQLYTSNPRQGPNFNEYCRALAARCHYLIQQWGWRKCSGIIGTIFDFFGSHSLGHLRNEEVYKSPRFLENLAHNPSLAVEPEDRCFHIFIKTLALVILRMKKFGLTKDIKNLVARTLPNHNRQYLKENRVRQQDLAALRNHHDLLCTLFWAAPPTLRPGVHLIEKLVVPGSSHKEACLINLRAWSQLARYIVCSGEGSTAFRPFMSWQTSTFQQLLDQYLSAASDIQQQFLALPKAVPRISNEVVDSMIEKNKAAAMDVLYLSIKASFEVLKLAGSLGTATSTLNIYQLQQVFTRFDFSPGFDWSIILVAIETLELYISKVEQAAEAQYSSDSSNMTDPQEVEEAVLLLDHRVAEQFFFMTRTLLELPDTVSLKGQSEHGRCIEKAVTLSARMACRFIHSGITRTVNYFTSRKYGLFRELPVKLGSPQRTYLPLFLATLVKNHVFDFKDVGPSLLGLWLMAIVKPFQSLAYENYLADILKQKNVPYLQRAVAPAGIAPDYSSNRDFLAAALLFMRTDLRNANLVQRKQRRDEHAKCLELTMQKMKEDLRALKPDPAEHKRYMQFVREIVALIKSHGVGICVVDPFFTQPSSDYSPPIQDPQLHTAGIIAYGVRLSEGEATAAPQLFHYLYNNFKIALANDKLDEECTILEHAMGNPHIISFMLGRVLPAVAWATSKANDAWPLLDVYVGALRKLLTRSCLPKEIDEDSVEDVSGLLKNVMAWFRTLQGSDQPRLSITQLHIIARLVEMASLFHPSLITHLLSGSHPNTASLGDLMASFGKFAEEAAAHLDELLETEIVDAQLVLGHLQIGPLLAGVEDCGHGPGRLVFQSGRELNPQVDNFANVIAADVGRNWAVTATSISWNVAGSRGAGLTPATTQSGPGVRYEFRSGLELARQLRQHLELWIGGKGLSRSRGWRPRRRARVKGELGPMIF